MFTNIDKVQLVPNVGWDPRILVCRCGNLVDTFIVVTTRYVVLIDSMINSFTASALLEIARPHLTGRQLMVVNTHADWDHAWGNHIFAGPVALYPAPVIASYACLKRLNSVEMKTKLKAMRAEHPGRFDDVLLTPPNLMFDRKFSIIGGDLTLELFATPGHKADHIAVYVPEIRTLFAGDAAELPFPFVESPSSIPHIRESLQRMAALQPTNALYCHAPVTSGPALLTRNLAYFDTIETRCRAALARGLTIPINDSDDVETLVNFPYEEAVSDLDDNAELIDFYRPGHRFALRAMLEYLSASEF